MAVDDMYMENLDEFVNDENKVVTFKWLSTNLKVHVNQAKQMLYAFVQQERNKKENDKLNVTYFVAGTPKGKNGCVTHQCVVTPEEELEAVKSTLSTVTSCHIYSVQKVKLKDPGTLYLADYDNTKEKIHTCNKYSAISCPRAKARSREELAKLGIKTASSQSAESSKINGSSSAVKPPANGTSSAKVKAEPKGSIANMFAGGGKKSDKSADVKPKEDVKEKAKQTKGGKAGGMMSFFSKQTDKPKPEEEKAESKKEDKEKKKEEEKDLEPALPALKDDKKEVKKEKKKETKKGRQSKGKKSTRVSDSDEEDKPDKKRRKRIRNDLFDSSSESEMDVLEESPAPSPVREPSPAPESPIPEKVDESDEEVQVVTETNGSQKRRKRTRKLVPKTFMDDEGFMVTEKVWESDSTDASETEEARKKSSPAKQTKTQANKKPSPHKKSPQKGSAKNQMSLTSFFKKK